MPSVDEVAIGGSQVKRRDLVLLVASGISDADRYLTGI